MPALESLRLQNYQSHKDTKLELGQFTVIVGSSSSGKSALVRALSTLANNTRGTSYVRHGAKSARVSAVLEGSEPVSDAQTHVVVERARNTSSYALVLPGEDEHKFTKCGTTTPELVTAALGFGGDNDPGLWRAGQFDRPYLLDETGSQVARVLGNLTGVSMIFAAVRECNRRASAAKSALKERRAELNEVSEAAQRFRGLPQRRSACVAAEGALRAAQEATQRRDRLVALLAEHAAAERRGRAARARLRSVPDLIVVLEAEQRRARLVSAQAEAIEAQRRRDAARSAVPAGVEESAARVGELEMLQQRFRALAAVLGDVRSAVAHSRACGQAVDRVKRDLAGETERFVSALTEAGSCPMCGADPEHRRVDRVAPSP